MTQVVLSASQVGNLLYAKGFQNAKIADVAVHKTTVKNKALLLFRTAASLDCRSFTVRNSKALGPLLGLLVEDVELV